MKERINNNDFIELTKKKGKNLLNNIDDDHDDINLCRFQLKTI